MKKILSILLVLATVLSLCLTLASCSSDGDKSSDPSSENSENKETTVKVGFIFLHDENSTYDLNFLNAAKAACEEAGVEYVFKTNIPETTACYDAAADLVDAGCNLIFADSFGHEPFILQAAEEFKNVEFCHATGTHAHTEKLSNFHNAFASIYEGRYLAGVAAGLKLNEMLEKKEIDEPKMGYVGAYTYAEVISGYTSFYLGAKSVCPNVTMDVQFTGSWYDETAEKEAATLLINRGCKLISQHADSMGAPTACESAGVPNVSYNGSTVSACPNTFIVSSRIDWAPYFKHIIECVKTDKAIEADWTGTLATGSVVLTDFNDKAAAAGTTEKVEAVKQDLESGKTHVFDTSSFTVDGKKLDSYMADVDTDANYEKDTEVISDGYFHESEFRSAPYFDLAIDGITRLNEAF